MSTWDTTENSAVISLDGRYRYMLSRLLWGMSRPLVFCMLNPSTADHKSDDPTIRRCIGFAKREDAHSLVVVNLYAWRSTDPAALPALNDPFDDPVGPENDETLVRVARGSGNRIVCAWGAGAARQRVVAACKLFRQAQVELVCLGTTKHGHPRHPLYVRGDQPLVPFKGDLV